MVGFPRSLGARIRLLLLIRVHVVLCQRFDDWRDCSAVNDDCSWTSTYACPGSLAGTNGYANDDGTDGFRCCCQKNNGYVRISAVLLDPSNLQALSKKLVFSSDAPNGNGVLSWRATFEPSKCGNAALPPADGSYYTQWNCKQSAFYYDQPRNSLPSGSYQFRLRASGSNDNWSGNGHDFYTQAGRATDTFYHMAGNNTEIAFTVTVGDANSGFSGAAVSVSVTRTPVVVIPDVPTMCIENCNYAADNDCDDGGPGAEFSICSVGTDCLDCGPRTIYPTPYYTLVTESLTWERASEYCSARGGSLASVTSAAEETAIETVASGESHVWLGGYRAGEGTWVWERDNRTLPPTNMSQVAYSNWGQSKPRSSGSNDKCMRLTMIQAGSVSARRWLDKSCGASRNESPFICQYSTQPPHPPPQQPPQQPPPGAPAPQLPPFPPQPPPPSPGDSEAGRIWIERCCSPGAGRRLQESAMDRISVSPWGSFNEAMRQTYRKRKE